MTIRRFLTKCIRCHEDKPVKLYVGEWQKKYVNVLPLPYCEECRGEIAGLTLYEAWVAEEEKRYSLSLKNNAELS